MRHSLYTTLKRKKNVDSKISAKRIERKRTIHYKKVLNRNCFAFVSLCSFVLAPRVFNIILNIGKKDEEKVSRSIFTSSHLLVVNEKKILIYYNKH